MGAEQSQPQLPSSNGEELLPLVPDRHEQFVLVCTAPAGCGKEGLMSRLIGSESHGRVGYCAKAGSVTANEPGLLYYYETLDDERARPSCEDAYPTIRAAIRAVLADGKSCVADVEVSGVRALRRAGVAGCYVFIVPPTLETMRANLTRMFEKREDGEAKAAEMFCFGESEIAALREPDLFDYAVVNESEDKAIAELQQCVAKGSLVAELARAAERGAPPRSAPAPHAGASQDESMSSGAHERMPALEKGVSVVAAAESGSTDARDAEALIVLHPGMARWEGKVALVTGASSGIGWAVCEALALAGMRVVACARRQERLEALQRHVLRHGINGQMFLPVVCDITKEAEVAALNKLVARQFGDRHVSVLVNNAGMAAANASLMDGDAAAWQQMVATNVLGVAMCCREACRGMRAANSWGHIINISSLSGHRVPQGAGSGGFYAGTKHAVRAMTEGLRQEARAAGVPLKVSEISPGVVHTNFFATMSDGDEKTIEKYLKTPGLSAYDIANTVLFMLATPEHMEINDVLVRPTGQHV